MRNELLISKFEFILDSVSLIQTWFSEITTADDYLKTSSGRSHFDATLMRLQSIGETLKKIDKENPEILQKHNEVNWHEIIKLREIISHHYEQLSPEIIYNICRYDIPDLKTSVEGIIATLNKNLPAR
jgi:uncharacterized protein with HEPN domain